MSLDISSRDGNADSFDMDFDFEPDDGSRWAENIVTATVAAFTVLFVSSVAVLMYFA